MKNQTSPSPLSHDVEKIQEEGKRVGSPIYDKPYKG